MILFRFYVQGFSRNIPCGSDLDNLRACLKGKMMKILFMWASAND